MIFLLLAALNPVRTVPLGQKYDRIEIFDHRVYLTQRFAKNLAYCPDSVSLENIPVTDKENFRIVSFQVTPFVYYLNTGLALIRFFPASGASDTIFVTAEISSFGITRDGDAVVGDRVNNALVFQDYRGQPLFTVHEVAIKDLRCCRDTVYALTDRKLLVFDKFGNPIREIESPGNLDRLFVADSMIGLFSPGQSYYYAFTGQWSKIELPLELTDLTADGEYIIVLGNHGTSLYYFLPADRRDP